MKRLALVLLFLPLSLSYGQNNKVPTLKSILLEQLRTTHNQEGWFVPIKIAVGVTPEQARWQDGHGNHSIGQLANHFLFWDSQELAKFKGQKPATYNGNNDETFNSFDARTWAATVEKLDTVLTEWERAVEAADDSKEPRGRPPSLTSARTTHITPGRLCMSANCRVCGTRRRE